MMAMASPVVTFAILSCVLLLTHGRSSSSSSSGSYGLNSQSDKIGRNVDFRSSQPDLPALYSAPRSHQEQEAQDNEVDQQNSTDREGGTTTEIYFDEGTSEDYQFTTGTTQNSRDFNSEPSAPSSSSSSSSDGPQEKSTSATSQGRPLGGYDDGQRQNGNFHQQQNESQNNQRNVQYQRRPLDQQQIENHHSPQHSKISSPLMGSGGSAEMNQIPISNSLYGPPTRSMNASSIFNGQPTASTAAYPTYPRELQIQPALSLQDSGLVFQQTQTRYLPPQLLSHSIQQQQHPQYQQQPQQQQQQYQPQNHQDVAYNPSGISIPPRITIPPRDSSTHSQTQIPHQVAGNVFSHQQYEPQQQQQQQLQHGQPENNGYQKQLQNQQNFETPQPSFGQYLQPQTQPYNLPISEQQPSQIQIQTQTQSQPFHQVQAQVGHQFQERQPHTLISSHQQQEYSQANSQLLENQPHQYLPPRNDVSQPHSYYQHQQQQQQQQQQPTNFGNEPENKLESSRGISQINTNSAFEIDEPHDDTIVDAELLLRVQRIIEEHERKQKEIQEKMRRENEGPEHFLRNKNIQESNLNDGGASTNHNNDGGFGYRDESYFGQRGGNENQNGNDHSNNHIQSPNDHFDNHHQISQGNVNGIQTSPTSQPSSQVTDVQQSQSHESSPLPQPQPQPQPHTQYGRVSNFQIGTERFPPQEGRSFSTDANPNPNGEHFSLNSGGLVEAPRHRFQQSRESLNVQAQGSPYEQQVYQHVTNSINNAQRYEAPSSTSSYQDTKSNSSPSPSETEQGSNENSSPIKSSSRKTSHIEYQKAILSDHFVETQTEFPSRANNLPSQPQHQEYLPPPSSLSAVSHENPTYDSRRVESFNSQFNSPQPIQSQSQSQSPSHSQSQSHESIGIGTSTSSTTNSHLNNKVNTNSNEYFRSDDQPLNEDHRPSTSSYPTNSNQLGNRQSSQGQNFYQSSNHNQNSFASPLQSRNQIENNARSFYGLPFSSHSQPQPQQQSVNAVESQSQFNSHNGPSLLPVSPNHNDNFIANQPGQQSQQQQNSYPSPQPSQDQPTQTYSLASMYPTSFTANGNARTIVVHEIPYGSNLPQGVSNRALITPADLLQSSNPTNQYFSGQSQDNSFNSNFLHSTPENSNSISYHQGSQSSAHSQSQAHPHESSGGSQPNQQFLSSQVQVQGQVQVQAQEDDSGTSKSGNYMSLPTSYTYSPSSSPYTLTSNADTQNQNQIPISTPQPIYGIPLAPALGPESIIPSSIDSTQDSSSVLSTPQNHFSTHDTQTIDSEQHHSNLNDTVTLNSAQFYPQQQQQQQQHPTFVSNSNNYLAPSQPQPQLQPQLLESQPQPQPQYGVIVDPNAGGGNTNFNHDQLYLNQILSAYNALAAQQISWSPHPQSQSPTPSDDELSHVNNVVTSSSFSRLPPTRIVYGPPPPNHSQIISLPSNDYFYPRRHRSVRKRLSAKTRSRTSIIPTSSTVSNVVSKDTPQSSTI